MHSLIIHGGLSAVEGLAHRSFEERRPSLAEASPANPEARQAKLSANGSRILSEAQWRASKKPNAAKGLEHTCKV